ncbi:MAG: type II toxin-antitoxin system PemK/MazF family toxin [Gemmataceae bacterium]
MISYQTGDLLLVEFPFTVSGPGKPRPALVILDSGDADVLLARVTTQAQTGLYDVPLLAWQKAGLLAPSIVRLHKLATLAKSRVHKHLGPWMQQIESPLLQFSNRLPRPGDKRLSK